VIVADAATVSALKTGPDKTYFQHGKGGVALEKSVTADWVKCPPHDNNHASLILGGPGHPIDFHKRSAESSSRWAVFTLTYVTRADGDHAHYTLKLKTVHGKTAKLCNEFSPGLGRAGSATTQPSTDS
jgi:hypothetical protein